MRMPMGEGGEGTCTKINERLGWDHGLPLHDCNVCWSLGGPTADDAKVWQVKYVELTVKNFAQPHLFRMLPSTVRNTIVRHLPEEKLPLVSEPPELPPPAVRAVHAAKSIASRLPFNSRVALSLKVVRNVSCHGDADTPACPGRAPSAKEPGLHFCADCKCGDFEHTHLDGPGYTKLDYPYLWCPRKRRGFSNYQHVFNAEGCGIGDMLMHVWHAEAYKKAGTPCAFHAVSPDRIALLKMFGQEVTQEKTDHMIVTGGKALHYVHEITVTKGSVPRAVAWSKALPDVPDVEGVDVKAEVPWEDVAWSRKQIGDGSKPVVLLFPFAEWNPRTWPLNYWIDLAWALDAVGAHTICMVHASKEQECRTFPLRMWGESWTRIAALMQLADCVVGNDSGPSHLAGCLDVPTVAVMGPLRNVFTHYGCVREVSAKEEVECTGCYFQASKGFRAACDVSCQSLMRLLPERVFQEVVSVVQGLSCPK